ncbi:MAG: adenosylmethionine decarboxylase [Erythrobacter sp.]|jgi:S-adenosylmethionine decarboxylase|nr:adenosylmethionine decarboxylase [Erythrobacter sp.]
MTEEAGDAALVRVGTHVLIDVRDASRLGEVAHLEAILRRAAGAAGATVLAAHFHHFGPGMGVTGVLMLAESHISIHTWPEHRFAALDVFMCGAARIDAAIEVIEAAFAGGRIEVRRLAR